jgi:hypothetical protein
VKVASTGTAIRDQPFGSTLPQFSADYVELPRGGGLAAFSGQPVVDLLPVGEGELWWSNRADSLNSRLTRRLDLRDVTSATLQFDAWYDIEDQFDYVYVSASRDGAATVGSRRRSTSPRSRGKRSCCGSSTSRTRGTTPRASRCVTCVCRR